MKAPALDGHGPVGLDTVVRGVVAVVCALAVLAVVHPRLAGVCLVGACAPAVDGGGPAAQPRGFDPRRQEMAGYLTHVWQPW